MTHDDLESPMTAKASRLAPRLPRADVALIIAVVVGAVLAFAGGWALLVNDPLGGEPVATAAIERRMPAPPPPNAPDAAPTPSGEPAVVTRNGVPVVGPGDAMPKSGPVIIRVPGADDGPSATAGGGRAAPGEIVPAMLEDSRYGPLPRIAPDGRRPLDAYARPAAKPAAGIARVALVVGGLGVSADATAEALRTLPPEVSVAFSPYAQNIADLVGQARRDGREALVQTPMEPFDYPANDPGPQTLLTALPASANLERLRWALGRASGYVGVAPLAGARFLENDAALQPVFAELARRGLMFVGAAGRDHAASTAEQAALPHARGAVAIDQTPDQAAIDAALARLESDARAGGSAVAVGWASASPLTLKRIAAWRSGLAARGVALVPVSAAAGAQGPS